MCPLSARRTWPWCGEWQLPAPALCLAEGTGEGSCRRGAGADRCEQLREEQDVKPQERLWVGSLLLHAVVGSVVLPGMGGRWMVGPVGLGEEGEERTEKEEAWPRCWLCRREWKSSRWRAARGLGASRNLEKWDEAYCGEG